MGFHEKLRLLYVACTRAPDHLVVSVHRTDAQADPTIDRSSTARRAALGRGRARAVGRRRRSRRPTPRRGRAPAPSTPPGLDLDAWLAEHDAAFTTGQPPALRVGHHARAPSRPIPTRRAADDPGLAKEGSRPRAAAVEQGSLRHRDRPRRARGAADRRPRDRRRARADSRPRRPRPKACSAYEATIAALARAALGEPDRARAACASQYWRETYVAVPVDGITLEGYVDLVYRDDDGVSSSSTTRPTRSTATQTRADARRALPGPGRRVRDRGRGRDGRAGRPLRVRVPRPERRARGRVRGRRARGRGGRGPTPWSRPFRDDPPAVRRRSCLADA